MTVKRYDKSRRLAYRGDAVLARIRVNNAKADWRRRWVGNPTRPRTVTLFMAVVFLGTLNWVQHSLPHSSSLPVELHTQDRDWVQHSSPYSPSLPAELHTQDRDWLQRPSSDSPSPPMELHTRGRSNDDILTANFTICHSGGGTNCVVDGDTFWFQGENIRIADIDTPETHPSHCETEARLGEAATAQLLQMLNDGTFSLGSVDRDIDRYGRKLRIVNRDGVSIGGAMVRDGVARWYAGGRRPWC